MGRQEEGHRARAALCTRERFWPRLGPSCWRVIERDTRAEQVKRGFSLLEPKWDEPDFAYGGEVEPHGERITQLPLSGSFIFAESFVLPGEENLHRYSSSTQRIAKGESFVYGP